MPYFMYNEDGAKLFQDNEKAPEGFVDCPSKVKGQKAIELEEKPKKKAKSSKKDD